MIGCYLLHFDPPYQHASHYLGWSTDVRARVADHLRGRGANLVAVARAAGCRITLVRVWPGELRRDERRRKKARIGGGGRTSYRALCPTCTPHAGRGRWGVAEIGSHRAVLPPGSRRCAAAADGRRCRRRAVLVRLPSGTTFARHLPLRLEGPRRLDP